MRVATSPTCTPGTSLTSRVMASMLTTPMSGARRPRTSTWPRLERERCTPSAYPIATVATLVFPVAFHVAPYPTVAPASIVLTCVTTARRASTGSVPRHSQPACREPDAPAAGGRGAGLLGGETAHHEDAVRGHEGAKLAGLLDGGDRKAGCAAAQGCLRGGKRAVAVAAGLDDRNEARAFRKVREDARAVGAERAEVDVGPPQRKRSRQRPPCRSTFMTSGISISRSPARRPESPRRCGIPLPAAAWM